MAHRVDYQQKIRQWLDNVGKPKVVNSSSAPAAFLEDQERLSVNVGISNTLLSQVMVYLKKKHPKPDEV